MKNLIRIEEFARRAGITVPTAYTYSHEGLLPKPRLRIGTTMFFHAKDATAFARKRRARRKTKGRE